MPFNASSSTEWGEAAKRQQNWLQSGKFAVWDASAVTADAEGLAPTAPKTDLDRRLGVERVIGKERVIGGKRW